MSDAELVELGRNSFRLRRNIGALVTAVLVAIGTYYSGNQDISTGKLSTSQIKASH